MANSHKPNEPSSPKKTGGLAKSSFTAAFVIFVVRLLGNIATATLFGFIAALRFLFRSRTEPVVSARSPYTASFKAAAPMAPVVPPVAAADTNGRFADTVFAGPAFKEPYAIAQRVHVVNLELSANVVVGRVFMYLYDKDEPHVRRVLRCDSNALREIFGQARFYMKDVPWDPKQGDKGLDLIKQAAADEVVDLVKQRLNARKKAFTAKPEQANAPAAEAPKSTVPAEPAAQPKISAVQLLDIKPQPKQPMPVIAPPVQRVDRPTKGDVVKGVVAQLGMTDRRDGQRTYQSFCVKLDVGGIHIPFFGVELEREMLEHNVNAGDTVSITFMGWQEIQGREGQPSYSKKLYKVQMIEKAKP